MRVVYYTYPGYLDLSLPFVRAMSRLVELHLVLEVTPESWLNSLFDVSRLALPSGIMPGDPVLRDHFPAGVRSYWQEAASFNLVVYNCPRSIHPATWWASYKAARFIRNLSPDLIHLDDVQLRLAWQLPFLRPIPIVLGIHDPEAHFGEQDWRTDLARRLSFSWARRFILHNERQREPFCVRWGESPNKVDVVALGVYDIYRAWIDGAVPCDDRTVLFFGRLSPYKGLEVLYQAAPLVAEKVQGVRFLVAGRPVRGYTPPLLPCLPNSGSIETVNSYITNNQLAELFQRATVVCCPYVDATQSGVILTAYAFGKPVVATRTGGIPEYVQDGETGLLVPPSDPAALAQALIRVLNEYSVRQRLAAGVARLRAGELGWNSIADRTMRVYSTALEKDGG